MTMKELATQYESAARLIRERLREIREQMAKTNDPEKIWHLKHRIADLTPMLTQMNELSWMLDHYYEIGGSDRDSRYGFNGKRKAKTIKPETNGDIAPDIAKRINRFAASNLPGLSLPNANRDSDRRRKGSEQKHHKSNFEACGAENKALYKIFTDLNHLFCSDPKRKRRIT